MSDTETPKEQTPETPAGPQTPEQEFEDPVPPPTFDYLVFSLRAQTEMHLGLLHFGDEKDKPKPNLKLAQHTIDMMAMLTEKTKGNLSLEEQRYLENSLTELRFRFVQTAEESKR
jgi:hypothetical protein